ncbi:response regulator [Parasediminibacterium sp. JCM 36343]|uniref:response regulator n=1 Tax=Parasediminibacterium sp. JCM 36343 TaxID=3374279 RepID=UPI00397ADCC3
MIQKFIIVDDDRINNILCHILIEKTLPDSIIRLFINSEEALEHIKSDYTDDTAPETVLLLDIYMNPFTGWDFLDAFEQLAPVVKDKFTIHILSASINPADKEKAANNKKITSYIEKPLIMQMLNDIMPVG